MKYLEFAMIIAVCLVCVSCGSEPQEETGANSDIERESISGSWQVVSAAREGQPTQTLDNTHFHFTTDSMFTNMPTQELPTAYQWSGNDILRQGTDTTIYTVHTLKNDSLEFSVVLQGFTFRLQLLRLRQNE